MANTNLTPEQLALLQQQWQRSMAGHANPTDALAQLDGYNYVPQYQLQGDGSGAESGSGTSQYNGLARYRTADGQNGNSNTAVDQYDPQGNYTGSAQWDMAPSWLSSAYLPFALMAAGLAPAVLGTMGAGGAGATAAGNSFDGGLLNSTIMNGVGGAEGAGAGAAAAGNSFDGGLLNSAVMNGTGGAEAAGAGGLAGGAGSAGASGAGGGSGAFLGEGVASGVPAWDAAAAKAASKVPGWLGPAATLLGAASGAQGEKKTSSQVSEMNPHLNPYVYDSLFPYVKGLLDTQMAPGYMQGYDDMRRVGMGLLGTPVAGNGFSKFFPGR